MEYYARLGSNLNIRGYWGVGRRNDRTEATVFTESEKGGDSGWHMGRKTGQERATPVARERDPTTPSRARPRLGSNLNIR
jgi:hypothetical protein